MNNKLNIDSFSLREKAEKFLETQPGVSAEDITISESLQLIRELLSYQSQLEKENLEYIRLEKEFHNEREYFRDIFNNQPAGLYRIQVSPIEKWKNKSWASSKNPPYSMEFASDRFLEILGVTNKDFAKNPFIISDLIHPDDKKSFVIRNEEANKKFIHFEWEGRLEIKGKIVWVRLESLPRRLESGDILWTGILYDLTEKKITEEELNETRLKLEDVLEGANIGTLEWNVQTGKIKFNTI